MKSLSRAISTLFITLVFSLPTFAIAADLADSAQLEAFVDGMVGPLMKNNNSPSGTVAIAHQGELIFAKGYGFEDVENQLPVDPYRTLFRPGSTSKLFTWVAVMQLEEQGKLDLDTDVNEYLESFQIDDTFDAPITLRHILTHTAGFEDGALGYLIIDDPEKALPLKESMKRYQPRRVNPPGKQTAYSNYATALAGLIIENLSGLTFPDYIRQNIFEPLGMEYSSFEEPLPEHLDKTMAASYKVESGTFVAKPFEIISSFGPAGAMSGTSTDLVRFGQAILNGGILGGNRILRQDTVDRMLSDEFSHDDRLQGMGLGFYANDFNGFRVMGHGGDTVYFHSYLGIDRENELTFFVSFTAAGGSPVRSSFGPSLYNEYFPRAETPPVPPEDFTERAARYAGNYGFWRSNFSTIEKALGLAGGVQVAPTENDTLMIALFGKAKQYVEVGENLFQEQYSGISLVPGISPRMLAFQENENGEITGFVLDGLPFMSLRRLAFFETTNFNLILLGLSTLVFIWVLVKRFLQRSMVRSLPEPERAAGRTAVLAAAANVLTLVLGAIVISAVQDQIYSGIPLLMKLWLVLPILAFLAGLYLVFRTFGVWKNGLFESLWARLRYSIVTLSAVFMCWFYWFWNILGYQYL